MDFLIWLELEEGLNGKGVRVLGRKRGEGGVLVWGDERGRKEEAVAAIDGIWGFGRVLGGRRDERGRGFGH